jgi:hypothetical protein
MSRGLCFYIDHDSPTLPLAVALWTLRKNYSGDVCVIVGRHTSVKFSDSLAREGISVVKSEVEFPAQPAFPCVQCWLNKILIHRDEMPFDTGIMYDCDHLFLRQFEDAAFDLVEENGLMSFHRKLGEVRGSKLYGAEGILGKLPKMPKVNGGCVGSVRKSPLIEEWAKVAKKMMTGQGKLIVHADEYALSYVTGSHKIDLGDQKWSYTVARRQNLDDVENNPEILATHYPMRRFALSPSWLGAFREAFSGNWLNLKTDCKMYGVGENGSMLPLSWDPLGIISATA